MLDTAVLSSKIEALRAENNIAGLSVAITDVPAGRRDRRRHPDPEADPGIKEERPTPAGSVFFAKILPDLPKIAITTLHIQL